jgi:hypothetical protein
MNGSSTTEPSGMVAAAATDLYRAVRSAMHTMLRAARLLVQ